MREWPEECPTDLKGCSQEWYDAQWIYGFGHDSVEMKKHIYTATATGWIEPLMPYVVGKVLDMGCGIGIAAQFCEEYWGVDWAWSALRIAKEDYPHGTYHCLNLETDKIPYPDKFFDTVILSEILEHLEDYTHCLEETKRLAKTRVVANVPVDMPIPIHYHPTWSEEDCYRVFGYLGKVEKVFPIGHMFHGVIIRCSK